MKIVILESLGIPEGVLQQYRNGLEERGHQTEVYERETDHDVLVDRLKDADAVVIANMPFGNEVIRDCPKLRFIDVAFTGVDHVGLEAAREKQIAVSNASGYSNQAVAELVLEMALSLSRNVSQVEKRCREFGTKDGLVGREIQGRKIGIVGTGVIGKRVAEIFHLLGCEIVAYDPHPNVEDPEYIHYATLDEVLAEADIVTLHCPLNESTRNLISREKIALMKPDAVLINAARGPVVDNQALAEALKEGKIGGAGIDVYEMEPPLPADYPLIDAPNTVLTPHIAFASQESMIRRAEIVFDNLDRWMEGNQKNIIL